MTGRAKRPAATTPDDLLTDFFDTLSSLRDCSKEVARLDRNAMAVELLELGRAPELEIPRLIAQMLQVERDLHRIRRKLLAA